MWRWFAVAALFGGVFACKEGGRSAQPRFRVPAVGLELPQVSGWVQDSTVQMQDEAKGGIALRLVRRSAVPGSPRIDVVLEPLKAIATDLQGFTSQQLQEMASLEDSGAIRITEVQRQPTSVGPRRAFKVRHEYVMGKGAAQVAITQITTLVVLGGRGVTVTAAGRTELFHPLSSQVNQILAGMTTPADAYEPPPGVPVQNVDTPPPPANDPTAPNVKPIDLGQVGGN